MAAGVEVGVSCCIWFSKGGDQQFSKVLTFHFCISLNNCLCFHCNWKQLHSSYEQVAAWFIWIVLKYFWGRSSQLFTLSTASTCQQAHQIIFMIGQKYPTGFFPAGLTGSRASRTRVSRGSRTKAAFVSQSANHLIITLTSQVWPTEVRLFSLLPCTV